MHSYDLLSQNPLQTKALRLPMASIHLTQMVGRLIRTENDSGKIIVLDPRICTKSYGQLLLENLPGFKVHPFPSASFKQ